MTSQLFYEVMFDDGSFSLDTFPEDIVVSTFSDTCYFLFGVEGFVCLFVGFFVIFIVVVWFGVLVVCV